MWGSIVAKRLASGRREDLLDGVMRIIGARGFSDVRISEIANELHCSVASLYKIAPSKDSLVLLAIGRWGEITLSDLEVRAERGKTASARARSYFIAGAESLHPLSLAFFADVERFESTRIVWRTTVADRYIDRFVELVAVAQDAGEVRHFSSRFLGEMLRQIGFVTRDERVLRESGLTCEQAVLEVDRIVWEGIRVSRDGQSSRRATARGGFNGNTAAPR
jgi:AcrR family transcriptional regulator